MISPPAFSLILFGLAALMAGVALAPTGFSRRIMVRALSPFLARFGEPVPYPPAAVHRAFNRGEQLVIITVEERAHVHKPSRLETPSC